MAQLSTQQMRAALAKKYSKALVDKMKDSQIHAMYLRLSNAGKI